MAGPAMAPLPTTLMWVPRALPRSAPLKEEMTVAMPLPWIMADPKPLEHLGGNQPRQIGGQSGQERPGNEDSQTADVDPLAPGDVAQAVPWAG